MRALLSTLILTLCFTAYAQESNVFHEGDFWKGEPTVKDIRKKIKEGHDPAEKAPSGFDGVAFAIINDAPAKSIKFMLKQEGNPVDKPTHGGIPYLLWSAYKGNVEIMQHLIEMGADTQFSSSRGTNMLLMAAIGGVENQAVYDLMFANGVDVASDNSEGGNVLHQLALSGASDLNVFRYLVDKGLTMESVDSDGNGLVNYAARGSNLTLLRHLIGKGHDYQSINKKGENTLFQATYSRRRGKVKLEVFEYLESLGLEVDMVNWEGKSPLHNAVRFADADLIDFFIERGVNPNQIDKEGNTVLHKAVGNSAESIEHLLAAIADMNFQNHEGYSPLTLAVQRGSKEAFDLLVAKGADVSVLDGKGDNLMMHAFKSYSERRKENFEYLISNLSEMPNSVDQKVFSGGNTLAHVAIDKNNSYLLQKAIELGVDLNHKNDDGVTPLHMAAMSATDEHMIQALLSAGADKKILTQYDESAYELASQNELLIKNEVNVGFLKID